jgi:hypothetical protein
VSWHPEDPRSWGGWHPQDARWGRQQPTWGWGHPGRPLYDNQLGHRLPTGGPPAAGQLSMAVAIGLFLLSPVTLLAWAAGQAWLRITGLRWWKLALTALAAIGLVVLVEGGPGPALAHHFSGYTDWLRQIGAAHLAYPAPGAFLWPQLPLAIPVGLLAAALNLAGRRQAIDPAEVRKQQRDATRRMDTAVRRATAVRDDHFGPVALGIQIDGDLGWAHRRGLVVVPRLMQNRSRLIVGTSGMGKTVDVEREAFIAARSGRKFFLIDAKGTDPGFVERALAGYLWGNPHARASPSGPSCPWTAGEATRPPSTTGSWPCSAGPSPTTKTWPPSSCAWRSTRRTKTAPSAPPASSWPAWTPSCWSGCTSTTPTAAAKPTAWSAGTRPGPSRGPSDGSPTSSPPPPAASTPARRLELRGRRLRLPARPLPGRPPGRRRLHAVVAGGLRPLRHPRL